MAGDQTREAELLQNHLQDLDQLAKMKEENGAIKKEQEHLRYETKTSKAHAREREREGGDRKKGREGERGRKERGRARYRERAIATERGFCCFTDLIGTVFIPVVLFRLEVKQIERRREQAREETARREEDLEQCRAELAEATEELDNLRHKFRDQLQSFVSGKV